MIRVHSGVLMSSSQSFNSKTYQNISLVFLKKEREKAFSLVLGYMKNC